MNLTFASVAQIYNISLSVNDVNTIQNQYPCRMYFIYMATDTFLLMYLCYLILKLIQFVFDKCPPLAFDSGYYGKHMVKSWLYQLSLWIVIVFVSKICVLIVNIIFMDFFNSIAAIILYPFRNNPRIELIMVMVIFPMIGTSIQLWWTDNFLQRQSPDLEKIPYNDPEFEQGLLKSAHFPITDGVLKNNENLI